MNIVLASASATRQSMLRAAGVGFSVVPANVDEPALRADALQRDAAASPQALAEALAAAKAVDVSRKHPEALVVGSDQILDVDGRILGKPGDTAGVRDTLDALRGKTHALHSAVAIAVAGAVVWSDCDTARLTMRSWSPAFIEDYIVRVGSAACQSVGAYQIEGLGIQLFDRIDGDHSTILGMPLLPLLSELRARGAIPT